MNPRNLKLSPLILPTLIIISVLLIICQPSGEKQASKLRFGISFTEEQSKNPLDGRMLLMVSTNDSSEPRFQINDGPNTQLVFGIDVNGLKPEEEAVIDGSVFGYPLKSIREERLPHNALTFALLLLLVHPPSSLQFH